ncbi:MAG TPA: helix-turn-helix domain-containing protein [Steroidobacteraceae bacterium]|nr:helix-turn-helix domain-containing protein [Steroidobacteraceae bacterium]
MARHAPHRHIPTYFLYGEAPRRPAAPLLHVETIEARSARHHWTIEPHRHQVLHQMILVLRGRGLVQAESARTQFRPPALMIMPVGCVHGFEFEPGTSGYVLSLSVELEHELARREPEIGALYNEPMTLELDAQQLRATDLAQAFRMLAREAARSTTGHELALQGWLEVLLGNVLRLSRQRSNGADRSSGHRRALVTRFSERIERRYRKAEPLTDYVAALNVSESRLRNACVALTGQTPVQLLHARVLLEAKRQLLYTDEPVRAIAYALGFTDAAYFTRFFSRQAGLSPRAFRLRGHEREVQLHEAGAITGQLQGSDRL